MAVSAPRSGQRRLAAVLLLVGILGAGAVWLGWPSAPVPVRATLGIAEVLRGEAKLRTHGSAGLRKKALKSRLKSPKRKA